MTIQRFPHLYLAFIFLLLFFSTIIVIAQDDANKPAPEFLYREDNHLLLVNGYTGEAHELALEVTDNDRFLWSPDGKYLLSRQDKQDETYNHHYCLNLYEVDAEIWLYSEPISCAVTEAVFSEDGTQIVYVTEEDNNGQLWLYNLTDETRQQLYQTSDGNNLRPENILSVAWSPTKRYLKFEIHRKISGGTVNSLVVMNAESLDSFTLYARNSYYASYYPIWSEDDRWFLITLQDEYVTSGALSATNHKGDVYLINTETGDQHRITYTPTDYEHEVHWTEANKIAFTVVKRQDFTFTLDEAINVEVVPDDEIVKPEPIDTDIYTNARRSYGVIISPDPNVGAWVSSTINDNEISYELQVGNVFWMPRTEFFSIPLPEDYEYRDILIGWRPSDYSYGLG